MATNSCKMFMFVLRDFKSGQILGDRCFLLTSDGLLKPRKERNELALPMRIRLSKYDLQLAPGGFSGDVQFLGRFFETSAIRERGCKLCFCKGQSKYL